VKRCVCGVCDVAVVAHSTAVMHATTAPAVSFIVRPKCSATVYWVITPFTVGGNGL
jgi:hypothetical protein